MSSVVKAQSPNHWINNLCVNNFPGGSDGKESAYYVGDRVQFLDREDLLKKGMATHSSIIAPWPKKKGLKEIF